MRNILTLPRIIIILAYILIPMDMEAILISFGISALICIAIQLLNE